MAEIAAVNVDFADLRHTIWANLLNTDTGRPQGFQGSGDKTVQFTGTFGTGGTVLLEGTCDKDPAAATWFILNDLQTVAISKTAAALEGIAESVLWVRPRVSAGDGTTSLTAQLLVRAK